MGRNDDRRNVGPSQQFVAARGFRDGVLVGADGTARLFLELTADTDRPEVRPREAWMAFVQALPVGWTARVLQAVWPDPLPRSAFLDAVERWALPDTDPARLLAEGLRLFLLEAPLPYMRRTVVELAVPFGRVEDALAFVEGALALLSGYGVQARVLNEEEIAALAHGLLNPRVV